MPASTRAAATVLLVCLLAAACSTDEPVNSQPTGPLPPVENAATLPAMYVPSDQFRAHGAVVSTDPTLCEMGATTCVPAGVYQQQQADGDWCTWSYQSAGEVQRYRYFKDADWSLVTLQEGDDLGYGPTTGATRYSEGLPNTQAWHGDGKQRGCAEWVQVGTLDDAVPLPRPTTEECKQLVAEGEAASSRMSDLAELHEANVEEWIAQVRAVLAADSTEMPDPAIVESALVEVMAAMQEAQPKVHRAEFCYSFLGDEQGASEMSNLAYGYIHAWANFKKRCPTEFAPAGLDCSRLGQS